MREIQRFPDIVQQVGTIVVECVLCDTVPAICRSIVLSLEKCCFALFRCRNRRRLQGKHFGKDMGTMEFAFRQDGVSWSGKQDLFG